MVAVSTLLNRLLQIVAYVASMSRDEPPWISRRLKLNRARLDSMKSRLLPAVSCQEELSPGVVEFAKYCVEMNGFGLLLASSDLKAVEHFSKDVNGVLVATDVAARGLDIPGIRIVIHYQLPHSADVYIHRSGRTARASSDVCSIALISPKDKAKFISLCKSMKKETLRQFPLEESYLPEVMKWMSLARQLDKISRKNTQENVKKNWLKRSAESLELTLEESGSEEETVTAYKQKRAKSVQLKNLQQELNFLLAQPLQPRTFSRRYLLGAGISFDLQKQLEQLSNIKEAEKMNPKEKQKPNFAVFGQQCIEPLQALRNSGHEVLPSRLYHIPAFSGGCKI